MAQFALAENPLSFNWLGRRAQGRPGLLRDQKCAAAMCISGCGIPLAAFVKGSESKRWRGFARFLRERAARAPEIKQRRGFRAR
jgi:hypothetical protein